MTISTSTLDIVIDKDQNSGTPSLYEISDFYTYSASSFTASNALRDGADCTAMYFYAFSDSSLQTTWSDPDIVLSAADPVDT